MNFIICLPTMFNLLYNKYNCLSVVILCVNTYDLSQDILNSGIVLSKIKYSNVLFYFKNNLLFTLKLYNIKSN